MSDGMTISEVSMQNDLTRLQTISHNLANVTTPGFKQQIAATKGFEQTLDISYAEFAGRNQSLSLPITMSSVEQTTDVSAGTLKFTGNALDMALADGVFLTVQVNNGVAYTRQGDLHINSQGRLVTAKGQLIAGTNGNVELTSDKPVINKQGQIIENGMVTAELKLVRMPHGAPIVALGDGLYQTTATVTELKHESVMSQGFVEGSNVNMTEQMVKMIELTRHFESTQRVMRGYDEMLDKAINVIGEF